MNFQSSIRCDSLPTVFLTKRKKQLGPQKTPNGVSTRQYDIVLHWLSFQDHHVEIDTDYFQNVNKQLSWPHRMYNDVGYEYGELQ